VTTVAYSWNALFVLGETENWIKKNDSRHKQNREKKNNVFFNAIEAGGSWLAMFSHLYRQLA
jgi:hypothetical protein